MHAKLGHPDALPARRVMTVIYGVSVEIRRRRLILVITAAAARSATAVAMMSLLAVRRLVARGRGL